MFNLYFQPVQPAVNVRGHSCEYGVLPRMCVLPNDIFGLSYKECLVMTVFFFVYVQYNSIASLLQTIVNCITKKDAILSWKTQS